MRRRTVVLDTNLWVSSYFSPDGIAGRAAQTALERYTVAFSNETLSELREVLGRETFNRLGPIDERMRFCDSIAAAGQIIDVLYQFRVFEDQADDKFFSLAYAAGADCIISGDERHVQKLKHLHGIQIWSPAQFLAREMPT